MIITIRPALAADAHAIGALAQQFADYLRRLGDRTAQFYQFSLVHI